MVGTKPVGPSPRPPTQLNQPEAASQQAFQQGTGLPTSLPQGGSQVQRMGDGDSAGSVYDAALATRLARGGQQNRHIPKPATFTDLIAPSRRSDAQPPTLPSPSPSDGPTPPAGRTASNSPRPGPVLGESAPGQQLQLQQNPMHNGYPVTNARFAVEPSTTMQIQQQPQQVENPSIQSPRVGVNSLGIVAQPSPSPHAQQQPQSRQGSVIEVAATMSQPHSRQASVISMAATISQPQSPHLTINTPPTPSVRNFDALNPDASMVLLGQQGEQGAEQTYV